MESSEKIIAKLQRPVKVPEEIRQAYTDTLRELPQTRTSRRHTPRMLLLAAALTIALAGTVVAAVIIRNNQGLNHTMHIENEMIAKLLECGLLSYPEEQEEAGAVYSAQDQGITISVNSALADPSSAVIALTVSGAELEDEDGTLISRGLTVAIDGKAVLASGNFYDGWIADQNGYLINDNGVRKIDLSEASSWAGTRKEQDGSITFLVTIYPEEGRENILGKEISIEIQNLAYFSPSNVEAKGEKDRFPGSWKLSWTLTGSADRIRTEPDLELGESGGIVKELEVSGITMKAVIDWPRIQKTISVQNKDLETEEQVYFSEPPQIAGVKRKDGTLLYNICSSGLYSDSTVQENRNWVVQDQYLTEDGTLWAELYVTSYILDLQEVEAVLFWKELPDQETQELLSEESFYVVPVG